MLGSIVLCCALGFNSVPVTNISEFTTATTIKAKPVLVIAHADWNPQSVQMLEEMKADPQIMLDLSHYSVVDLDMTVATRANTWAFYTLAGGMQGAAVPFVAKYEHGIEVKVKEGPMTSQELLEFLK